MKKENKKLKTNPVIKSKKYNKNISLKNEDDNEIKSFFIIVIVIAAVLGLIYILTESINKKESSIDNSSTSEINYDKLSIGMLLNRPYDTYYVLIFNSKDTKAAEYTTLLSSYMQKRDNENYIKIYFCDLANSLNSKYYDVNNDSKSNVDAKKIEDLDLGNLTLLKIENKQIVSYIEEFEQIEKLLN